MSASENSLDGVKFERVEIANIQYLNSRVVWQADECETKFFVILLFNEEVQRIKEFSIHTKSGEEFYRQVTHLMSTGTKSDESVFIQQKAKVTTPYQGPVEICN